MRLLPEATELIYAQVDGSLRRLPRMLGWGRAKLPLLPADDGKNEEDLVDDEADNQPEATAPGQPRNSTPDAMFRRVLRRKLLQPLASVADQYLVALQSSADQFPDAGLAKQLHVQLCKFKLADEDIDLLLCLTHVIGRTLKQGGLRQLQEPTFYQAVFVDEVQDFTEQQVFLMVEQSNPKYRAVTVVGDIAQKLHHGSSIDLKACFPGQSVPHVLLTENLRQADAPGLALFSACFRAALQGGTPPSQSLAQKARDEGASLVRPRISVCETDDAMDARIVDALLMSKRHQRVAVLFPYAATAARTFKRLEVQLRERMVEAELSEKVNLARRHVRHFADVANSKGMDIDVVLLAGVDRYELGNPAHINRLYVGITRARQSLVLLSRTKELAPPLVEVRKLYQELAGQP
jgi:DNA helicase IV